MLRSGIDLLSCVNNFMKWTGCSIPDAIRAVTSTPATMLGVSGSKGFLQVGADADLLILEDDYTNGSAALAINEVWKFGRRVIAAAK